MNSVRFYQLLLVVLVVLMLRGCGIDDDGDGIYDGRSDWSETTIHPVGDYEVPMEDQ